VSHVAVFLGDFRKVITRQTKHYFEERWTFFDCRGDVTISKKAHFGFGVKIVSASHRYNPEIDDDNLGKMNRKTVIVDDHAWIGSHALLYDCHVNHHAVVGAGAVVKGVIVPSYSIVEGNPAKVISIYIGGRPQRLEEPIGLEKF